MQLHAAIYGQGAAAAVQRGGKIKKVTEDCQEDIRPLSRHVKEWEARREKPDRRPQGTENGAQKFTQKLRTKVWLK